MTSDQLIEESPERCPVLLRLEPVGVEVEAKGCTIRIVMPVEVGHEHFEKLLLREVWRTAVDHGAADLLKHELIQGHFLGFKNKCQSRY